MIGSDVMTSILDFKDRATCVLFGDGAGAVLIEPATSDSEGILDFMHDVDGSGGCNLYMPAGGSLHPASHETVDKRMHYVHQEGQQVFKYAVRRMSELACQILERNGFSSRDLALVVPHQANMRIIRAMQERLGVDDSKIIVNIDRYGNTTAATIPLGLMDAVDQTPAERRPDPADRRGRGVYHRGRPDALGVLTADRRYRLSSPENPRALQSASNSCMMQLS